MKKLKSILTLFVVTTMLLQTIPTTVASGVTATDNNVKRTDSVSSGDSLFFAENDLTVSENDFEELTEGFFYEIPTEDKIYLFYSTEENGNLLQATGDGKEGDIVYPYYYFDTADVRVYRVYGTYQYYDEAAGETEVTTAFFACDKNGKVIEPYKTCDFWEDYAIFAKAGKAAYTSDSGIVSMLEWSYENTKRSTGTAPFDTLITGTGENGCLGLNDITSDEKNLAGLDCCEDNDILRVGDTLTYDVRAILSVNVPADPQNPVNNLYGSKDAYLYTSFVGGKVYYEATIPVTAAGKLSWDTDAISSWMQDIKVSEDGRTLTGYVKLDETQISVPGNVERKFQLRLDSAMNGTELLNNNNPIVFRAWMEGNEADASSAEYEAKEKKDGDPLYASAGGNYNVEIKAGNIGGTYTWKNKNYWEGVEGLYETEIGVYGKTYNATAALQVISNSANSRLGSEVTDGSPISFDIDIQVLEKISTKDPVTGKVTVSYKNVTHEMTPTVTAFDYTHQTYWFNNNNYTNIHDGFGNGIPLGKAGVPFSKPYTYMGGTIENSINDSGNWHMQGKSGEYVTNENKHVDDVAVLKNIYSEDDGEAYARLHLSVEDYVFGTYPVEDNLGNPIDSKVGYFSNMAFQFFVPGVEGKEYQIVVKDHNLDLTTVSGRSVTDAQDTNSAQYISSDNLEKEGSSPAMGDDYFIMNHYCTVGSPNFAKSNQIAPLSDISSPTKNTANRNLIGTEFRFGSFVNANGGSPYWDMKICLNLSKFDAGIYQPVYIDRYSLKETDFRELYYGIIPDNKMFTLEDGMQVSMADEEGNWYSDDVMEQADICDLEYYRYDDWIKSGKRCVAVMMAYGMNDPNAFAINSPKYSDSTLTYYVRPTLGYTADDIGTVLEICNRVALFRTEPKAGFMNTYRKAGSDEGAYVFDVSKNSECFASVNSGFYIDDSSSFVSGGVSNHFIKNQYAKNGAPIEPLMNLNAYNGTDVYLMGVQVSVDTKIATKGDNGKIKTQYNIGINETNVELEINPKIQGVAPSLGENEERTIVTLKQHLPKGISYRSGSTYLNDKKAGDYKMMDINGEETDSLEPYIEVLEDGTTVLSWYIETGYTQKMPVIYCGLSLNSKMVGEYVFETFIDCPEDSRESGIFANNIYIKYDKVGIEAYNTADAQLSKEVKESFVMEGEDICYSLTLKNSQKSVPLYDGTIFDLLPYMGDNRASNFHGGYRVKSIEISTESQQKDITDEQICAEGICIAVAELDEEKLASKTVDLYKLSKEKEITWKEITSDKNVLSAKDSIVFDNLNLSYEGTTVPYIRIYTEKLEPMSSLVVKVILEPIANQTGDVYANNAIAYGTDVDNLHNNKYDWKEDTFMNTPIVTVGVYNRTLTGLVWEDVNENGVREEKESLVKDAEVFLYRLDEDKESNTCGTYLPEMAELEDGSMAEHMTTEEDGKYLFTKLREGDYKVVIRVNDDYYRVTKFRVAGAASNVNSDAIEAEQDMEYYQAESVTGTIDVTLPSKESLSGRLDYWTRYHDMGIVCQGEITVDKQLLNYDEKEVDGTDLTFYAGLFDQDKTLIDVKALVWDETKKDYSPVTFTNLQKGTYLVFETDEEGVPVKEDEDYQISYLVESVFDNQNTSTPKKGKVSVVLDNEVPQSQITIINKVRMEGEILIEKTIDLGEYTTSDYPTFIFKLTYLGIDGTEENGCTYYRSISFTGEENVGTAVFEKLPFGYYQLEELNSMRYEFKGLELKNAIEAEGEVTGHTALIQLTGKSATITASYLNEKNNDHNFSDSDIVTNYFKKTVDENGNVTSEGFKVDVVR